MVGFWRSLTKPMAQPYQVTKLIDFQRREEVLRSGLHFVCDIDKTYLETEFDSVARMARIAFESATDKITVAGAAAVLQLARWGDPEAIVVDSDSDSTYPRPLHFVSSSPPQLRAVLEEKMQMDGLDWSSDTFKNQAYNLRMGRMDLLRQHVAYKTQAILNLVAAAGPGARFVMIGDNAESDGYIYCGIKLLLDGRLSPAAMATWLEAGGVEAGVAREVTASVGAARGTKVSAILIRRVPGYPVIAQPPLSDCIQTFESFYQAGLLLMARGLLPSSALWPLTRRFHNQHGLTRRTLRANLDAIAKVASGDFGRAIVEASQNLGLRKASPSEPVAADTDTEAGEDGETGETKDPRSFDSLTEGDILALGRTWAEKLAARRAKKAEEGKE